MKSIIFNPKYSLKPDDGRALILASLVGRNLLEEVEDSFTNIVHPIYAMLLCFMNGDSYDTCIEKAANEIGVPKELIASFVDDLLDNSNSVAYKTDDGLSVFPPYTIITQSENIIKNRYTPDLFYYKTIDLCQKRHMTPTTVTLMVNNVCVTNCIYCYQDKSRVSNCIIPLERIKEIINQAYKLNVNTFDVIGGEFFLYKYWKEVLAELRRFGYNPYLSTKMPLEESDIEYLSELGVYDIQISIDTFIEEHLKDSIGIHKGYANKILNTIKTLDKYGIKIMVHSVLTKYNQSVQDMDSIYKVLQELKNLSCWHVVKGEETLYPKKDYKEIEIDNYALNEIIDYLTEKSKEGKVKIVHPQGISNSNDDKKELPKIIKEKFFNRSFCSGLFSSLYILPDGQVTICEQLYWNKRFIIGNIMENDLEDIWNSETAKKLYYIKQDEFPADSICRTCADFHKCRDNRQVCYREIIKKYGKEKWYYPDVNCPYAKKQG